MEDQSWRPSLNPAAPTPGTVLCALTDLADPGAKGFVFRADEAMFLGFVVRQGLVVHGYVDNCPHAGWPLASVGDRYLTRNGAQILCSAHGALFAPDTGLCTAGPCAGKALTPWPVTLEEGTIRVG